jgi:regulator of nonsense transcripts 3
MSVKQKVVIRRLPPNLPEAIFKQAVENWSQDFLSQSFIPGKIATSLAKVSTFARAYIVFNSTKVGFLLLNIGPPGLSPRF